MFRPRQNARQRGQVIRVGGGGYGRSRKNPFQVAMDKANAANEERYGQIKAGYQGLHNRVMGNLAQSGQQERKDIDEIYRNQSANTYQNLVNRGFGNSSLASTMQMGNVRERNNQIGRLNDRRIQQQTSADMGITQGLLGAVERRNDIGPQMAQVMAAYQNLGAGGYGQPAYGGPGGGGATYAGLPVNNNFGYQMPMPALMQQQMLNQQRMGGGMQRQNMQNLQQQAFDQLPPAERLAFIQRRQRAAAVAAEDKRQAKLARIQARRNRRAR